MEEEDRALVPASRIYFAVHHPILYNVKVKKLGYVHPDYLPTFLGYWHQENTDSKQDIDVTGDQGYAAQDKSYATQFQDPADMY